MTTSLPGIWSSRRQSGGGGGAITWTGRTSQTTQSIGSVTHDGTTFAIGCGSGEVCSSPDGITWTSKTTSATSNYVNALAGNGSIWIFGSNSNEIKSSTDLITWTPRATASGQFYDAVWDGTKFILTGYDSTWNDAYIYNSSDGITWAFRATSSNLDGAESICHGGSRVAIASRNTSYPIAYSDDHGDTWTAVNKSVSNGFRAIACNSGGTKWVAGGDAGDILTSNDGATWTTRTAISGAGVIFTAACSGAKFIMGDNNGKAYESDDNGVTWSETSATGFGGFVRDSFYAESKFIIVGAVGDLATGV